MGSGTKILNLAFGRQKSAGEIRKISLKGGRIQSSSLQDTIDNEEFYLWDSKVCQALCQAHYILFC